MLAHLVLHYVGPSRHLEIRFAPGLNLLTGDNGAGKTFLLDVAWWALTRTWVRAMARPWLRAKSKPRIDYKFTSKVTEPDTSASFDRERWDWRIPKGRPGNPGLVLYARVDGGFAVWDPARNARRRRDGAEELPRDPAYIFSPSDVWDGLFKTDVTLDGTQTRRSVCNGLIADWVAWQRERDVRWTTLVEVLRAMSPPHEPLEPAEPSWQDPDESRAIPTLRLYGRDVPITLASAGMRRVVALAYLLVWAWFEHQRQCELRGLRPTRQITFLVDEVEAHLHPKWQRVILRALRGVVDRLAQAQHAEVQIIAATHSPLVMASTEPIVTEGEDALFRLEAGDDGVTVRDLAVGPRGDVVNWLVKEFGLEQARSLEAEEAIEAAEAWMRGERALKPPFDTAEKIDRALRKSLPADDHFWARWILTVPSLHPVPKRRRTRR